MNSFLRCEKWRVHGRVQRVGFRHFSMRAAHRHRIQGAARNEPDGTVEIIAIGTPSDLEGYYRDILKGPSLSNVTHVERYPINYDTITLDAYDLAF
ncbi:acylphosphatase [bacterium]|nr:acylphosphatase [candidate division CSSED10-310 bacterium]